MEQFGFNILWLKAQPIVQSAGGALRNVLIAGQPLCAFRIILLLMNTTRLSFADIVRIVRYTSLRVLSRAEIQVHFIDCYAYWRLHKLLLVEVVENGARYCS